MSGSSDIPWFARRLRAARTALDARDAGPALALLAGARRDPELRSHYLDELSSAGEETRAVLGAQLHMRSHDPDAWLLMGASLSAAAFEARGSDIIKNTSEEQLQGLYHYSGLARDALHRAASLLPSDPVPWCQLLSCAMAASSYRDEVADIWAEVVGREGGDIYGANVTRLLSLAGKWHGSEKECFDFARQRTQNLPPGHPLLALVPMAHVEALVARMMKTERKIVLLWHLLRHLHYGNRRAEIDAASDRLMAGADHYLHHPGTMRAHQAFACVYDLIDAHDRARLHLERGGDRCFGLPWAYLGGEEAFDKARLAAGLTA